MKARTAWLAGAAGTAVAVYRRLRRQETAAAGDPRAEELRQKLEESRAVVEEQHEEAAAPEIPVDEADVDERRRALHERAQAAAEEMRGSGSGSSQGK